ncbi:MAG: biopolymer transporter ExbD [Pirellulaceae bacterium]|jgi:biopolymer transport protein ExbD|nr:biopolymer transporter ExbD [Pirellulaceae bacterium]MDP6553587.1 biopolymer transporter ExbD [Pirellulaceae bacterium]
MKIKKGATNNILEGDLTPMIDMTFQLIAFFMVLINFTQSEQNEKVKLPSSVLAKPAKAPLEFPITLHLTEDATVVVGGQEVSIGALSPFLIRERNVLEIQGKTTNDATIVVRAHKFSATGRVQELIKKCQENNFEKFALRAKEDVGN